MIKFKTILLLPRKYELSELSRGSGAAKEYFIPGDLVIRDIWIQNKYTWFRKGEGIWVNAKVISTYMKYLEPEDYKERFDTPYNGAQYYYDTLILGIRYQYQRPKCDNEGCNNELQFNIISCRGYGHCDSDHLFCSPACRDEYCHRHRLNGFELQNDYPEGYKKLQAWYKYGGGLKYYQDHKDDYWKEEFPLEEIEDAKFRLSRLTSFGHKGIFTSHKNHKLIVYKSDLEHNSLIKLEQDPNVVTFSYESIDYMIKYFNTEEQEYCTYRSDIYVRYKTGLRKLIEVKPISEVNYIVNLDKFAAARKYCEEHNMVFEVWTEKEIYPKPEEVAA